MLSSEQVFLVAVALGCFALQRVIYRNYYIDSRDCFEMEIEING
jgi:hypothetical protein